MKKNIKNDVWIYSETNLPTQYGKFRVCVLRNDFDDKEHLALVKGDVVGKENVPVRIHSECLTSEVLGSLKCDCRDQLQAALKYISDHRQGVVLYLRQEGRGIGLGNKIRAYALQEEGYDTVEANHILGFPDDLREYDVAAGILSLLGIQSVQLLTNNPKKIDGLRASGIGVTKRIPIQIESNPVNRFYLETKAKKSGHLLDLNEKATEIGWVS